VAWSTGRDGPVDPSAEESIMSNGRISLPTLEQIRQLRQVRAKNLIDKTVWVDVHDTIRFSRGRQSCQPESDTVYLGDGRRVHVQQCERYVPILLLSGSGKIFYGRIGETGFQELGNGHPPAVLVELTDSGAVSRASLENIEPILKSGESLESFANAYFFGDLLCAETTDLPYDPGTPRPEPSAAFKREAAAPSPCPGGEIGKRKIPRSLCDQVRSRAPRAKYQAQLVAFMEDRESASYLAVAENVYGDTATDGRTIKQLVVRTNATLKEIGAQVSFHCGSEHVHKRISPE
jgi:hypothetical protein